jgi:hypothetical protein
MLTFGLERPAAIWTARIIVGLLGAGAIGGTTYGVGRWAGWWHKKKEDDDEGDDKNKDKNGKDEKPEYVVVSAYNSTIEELRAGLKANTDGLASLKNDLSSKFDSIMDELKNRPAVANVNGDEFAKAFKRYMKSVDANDFKLIMIEAVNERSEELVRPTTKQLESRFREVDKAIADLRDEVGLKDVEGHPALDQLTSRINARVDAAVSKKLTEEPALARRGANAI